MMKYKPLKEILRIEILRYTHLTEILIPIERTMNN